jgi:hypothetical protein
MLPAVVVLRITQRHNSFHKPQANPEAQCSPTVVRITLCLFLGVCLTKREVLWLRHCITLQSLREQSKQKPNVIVAKQSKRKKSSQKPYAIKGLSHQSISNQSNA